MNQQPPPRISRLFSKNNRTNKRHREQLAVKFFTLNFTLAREVHPFENRVFLERSRAPPARISRREEPLN
jgi:hypothetical protein